MKKKKKTLLQERIEKIRALPDVRLRQMIKNKTIYDYLAIKSLRSYGKRGLLLKGLIGAGREKLRYTEKQVLRKILEGKADEIRKTHGRLFSNITTILKSAGIIETYTKKGRVCFKIIDVKRLKDSLKKGSIIYK